VAQLPDMQMQYNTPPPCKDESPTLYAYRVGQWYASLVSETHKKTFGQYLTPVEIAMFMAQLCNPEGCVQLRVLDPGAGTGILSCALCETVANYQNPPEEIVLETYETDTALANHLAVCLSYLKQWLKIRRVLLDFKVNTDDFVMTYAQSLDNRPRLIPTSYAHIEPFDIVISNPPYFKIPKSDPRAKAAALVVHGQPNIYALFMAVSASLLKLGGEFIFITPRSYAAGPYFRVFRKCFFENMRPEAIHLFGSRRDAFSRDEVLQENVILYARRLDGWPAQFNGETVRVSSSAGIDHLLNSMQRDVAVSEVLDFTTKDKVLRIPVGDEDADTAQLVRSWQGKLRTYGLEISTGPVVPFRAASLLAKTGNVPDTHAPLLWMQNVTTMQVEWPAEARGKEQYIIVDASSLPLLVAAKNYVLLRRFSAKEQNRRLTAAPFLARNMSSPFIGLENHLNYIHRPGGSLTAEEAYGLAVLFNSTLLDTYFRSYNGNTQVSATELRAMPLPTLDVIVELGKHAMALDNLSEKIDLLIEDSLRAGAQRTKAGQAAYG